MHKGEVHITLKEKMKNLWGGIASGFTSKKKLQEVDNDGYEEGKSKVREINIPNPYIPPEG